MSYDTEAAAVTSPASAFSAHLRKAGPAALVSGLGGTLAIWCLATVTQSLEQALLIAPFGASCVLLFALPSSPLARPRNVIGGHFLSALVGLLVLALAGDGTLACGIGVGLAIAVMQFTGTLHPPAGGNPLVVIMTGAGWPFLVLPVLAGTIALVALAWAYHRAISRRSYPG
ncbi:HPP family protein [Paracoccus siganidrum]|uniref:HPP family protein n=1 Tax=Paracoccus siganidrum TaxID=1276757 RepID=A0A419AB70_9RHOB|nr:HPP family protein [Paracoccus siganidrum]RJL20607.1 HPP family protein [Paracoccus siganidrum]RMC38353.1 HPP family protein [Paracoccus siganidrum]